MEELWKHDFYDETLKVCECPKCKYKISVQNIEFIYEIVCDNCKEHIRLLER